MKNRTRLYTILAIAVPCAAAMALLMGLTALFGTGSGTRGSAVTVMAGNDTLSTLQWRDTTEPPPLPVTEDDDTAATVDLGTLPQDAMALKVSAVLQLPELPNGCEIVSLATVLQYLGFSVEKSALTRTYLPMGKLDAVSPYKSYVGSPFSGEKGYGCYAPVILDAANRFFADNDAPQQAYSLNGKTLEQLTAQLGEGCPVIVWATVGMTDDDEMIAEWTVDGERCLWYRYAHCLVLIGYTDTAYIFADPLAGVVSYPKAQAEHAYSMLGCQAVGFRK